MIRRAKQGVCRFITAATTGQPGPYPRRGFTLAELIMAIALLAFFSTLVVQVFAQAQTVTKKAETMDLAVNCAADLADRWKMSSPADDLPDMTKLQQNMQSGRMILIDLDDSFADCEPGDAVWQARLTLQSGDLADYWLLTIDILPVPSADADPFFTLQAGHYWPAEGGAP